MEVQQITSSIMPRKFRFLDSKQILYGFSNQLHFCLAAYGLTDGEIKKHIGSNLNLTPSLVNQLLLQVINLCHLYSPMN